MIHRPSVYAAGAGGRHGESQQDRSLLMKIEAGGHHAYLRQANGLSDEKITELLEAETWMLADKVVERERAFLVLPMRGPQRAEHN